MNAVLPKVLIPLFMSWALSSVYLQSAVAATETLTLQEAEVMALSNEPGLESLDAKTQSMRQLSVADGQLMDPKIQVGILNLPTDTFDFDQEPMTQLKVSYIQQFPSGNTRQIKSEKSIKQSRQFVHRSEDRRRAILKQVRLSFLEVLYWDQALKTIEKNRQLLNQLSEIVQSLFSLGRNPQLDVLTVQLQQSKLDDRLTQIEQKINQQRFKLSEWIGEPASKRPLSDQMPVLLSKDWLSQLADYSSQLLTAHPKVLDINTQLEITRKDIELTRESEKPGWNLNLSYSYRDDAPNGDERADFVSAVVTLDVPLFTENRQNKIRQSQIFNLQSNKDQRDALLRQMTSELSQLQINESLIEQRMLRYNNSLIPQARQRAESAMQSYQSGNGGFSSVMQAYIDALNTELDAHRLRIDLLKNQAEAMYLVEDL
ncbi:MAG: TolC family protein [Gammaproteobacteria bacterium]|nr:TolC family protein [Gammaproteobacteria bacterium]